MNKCEGYRCTHCGSAYQAYDDAACCCANVKDVFLCGNCGVDYDEEADAEACCLVAPSNEYDEVSV